MLQQKHPETAAFAELIGAAHHVCLLGAMTNAELPRHLELALQRLDRAVGALETLAEAKR